MNIKWTLAAKKSFKLNIAYLLEDWTTKEVQNFTNEVFEKVLLLSKFSHLGKFDNDLNCYKFVLSKQITLLYTIECTDLVLLLFWNNYKKPLKRLK